jgi:hypothetical protein
MSFKVGNVVVVSDGIRRRMSRRLEGVAYWQSYKTFSSLLTNWPIKLERSCLAGLSSLVQLFVDKAGAYSSDDFSGAPL